jgi:hypothetical protein
MNAAMGETNAFSPPELCTVLVLYHDTPSRTRAMTACDYLVSQFWKKIELKFHWWRTDFLGDPDLATIAAQNAIESDILILSVGDRQLESTPLEAWFESWITQRQGREGALLDLSAEGADPIDYLHEICSRGGFDYLLPASPTEISSSRLRAPQGSPRPAALARQDRQSRPPSRFGLND